MPEPGLLVGNWGFRPGVTRAEEDFRAGGGIFMSFRHNLLVLRVVLKRIKQLPTPSQRPPLALVTPGLNPQF